MGRLEAEEKRVKGGLQWIQEDAEDQTSTDEHEDDHPEHADAVVELKRSIGQKVPEDVTAIERRHGDEVEDKEKQIQQDDVIEEESYGKELRQILRRDPGHAMSKRH